MKRIHIFAAKWFDKFRDKKIDCIELVDHYMVDDCEALGFVMDCGYAFTEKYGNAANDFEALERIIGQITDISDWVIEITSTEGTVYKYRGSLIADFEVDGVDLSDMAREALGMDGLYVFDGKNKPDRVDRISTGYHRITKSKPKQPVSETAEYVTWDYTERLVIDRESETIEHIQSIGSGCVVSRKFYVQGGVEGLLDDINADELFGEIEGNPDDIVENPLEAKGYTMRGFI